MKRNIIPLIVLAVLLVLPFILRDPYYLHLMILVLMWVALGSGWNLISGYTGQVSFGTAAFFGVGAYSAALLMSKLGISAWWGLPLGAFIAVLLSFPFGWISFRLRGPYFALVTLALNEILRHIATIWESLTDGMVGILVLQTFISKQPYYYIMLAIAVTSIIVIKLVMDSKLGYYFVTIREDQEAAESLGINTVYYKMVSLCISAAIIGFTGALYTNYMGFIDPKIVFALGDISIMAILVGIVGGVATIYGPAIGAFIMVAVQEFFRTAGFGLFIYLANLTGWSFMHTAVKYISQAHVLSFGLLVIFVIRYLPNGVVGDWDVIKRKFSFGKTGSV